MCVCVCVCACAHVRVSLYLSVCRFAYLPVCACLHVQQAPIGIITSLLASQTGSLLVTHTRGSTDLHLWNVESATKSIDCPDKLTAPVQRLLVTKDSSLAFVQCCHSDEVGVIDMRTGKMLDLLTHDCKVSGVYVVTDVAGNTEVLWSSESVRE